MMKFNGLDLGEILKAEMIKKRDQQLLEAFLLPPTGHGELKDRYAYFKSWNFDHI